MTLKLKLYGCYTTNDKTTIVLTEKPKDAEVMLANSGYWYNLDGTCCGYEKDKKDPRHICAELAATEVVKDAKQYSDILNKEEDKSSFATIETTQSAEEYPWTTMQGVVTTTEEDKKYDNTKEKAWFKQTPARQKQYSSSRFACLIADTIEQIEKLSTLKGGEYAGDDDRLSNFRRLSVELSLPIETIWLVYSSKHFDAIKQYVSDLQNNKSRTRLEPVSSRVDDMIVYLILFKAILQERNEK